MTTETLSPDRIETQVMADGFTEERVYIENKLVLKRRTPPAGCAPRGYVSSWLPEQSI